MSTPQTEIASAGTPTAALDPTPSTSFSGHAIVFADRGHVWVGEVSMNDAFASIKGARVIRRWGTTQGLNELALKGPLSATKLDARADILVSRHAVLGIIPTEASLWNA